MRQLFVFIFICLSAIATQAGVYDTLEYGDDRDTVARKLKKSKMVSTTANETFFGRLGLNGVFKCNAKLAGLTYHLYFDWDDNGGLKEVTLRSEDMPDSQYGSKLYSTWQEAKQLLTQAYNPPAQSADYPNKSDFKGSPILISTLWKRGTNNSVLLGTGREKGKCFLCIRFTNEKIELRKK